MVFSITSNETPFRLPCMPINKLECNPLNRRRHSTVVTWQETINPLYARACDRFAMTYIVRCAASNWCLIQTRLLWISWSWFQKNNFGSLSKCQVPQRQQQVSLCAKLAQRYARCPLFSTGFQLSPRVNVSKPAFKSN